MAEIFLMEDNASLRRILSMQLRDSGYNVTSFENGLASDDVDLLASADVLLTDLQMPEINGEQVIANVRSRFPNLPIIIISGEEQARLDEIDSFAKLRKPFDESQLISAIERALNTPRRGPRAAVA